MNTEALRHIGSGYHQHLLALPHSSGISIEHAWANKALCEEEQAVSTFPTLRFDSINRTGLILFPNASEDAILLPPQDVKLPGFERHELCLFSDKFSSYLAYLTRHHILFRYEEPDLSSPQNRSISSII